MNVNDANFIREAEPVADKFVALAKKASTNRTTYTLNELQTTAQQLSQLHQKYYGNGSVTNALNKYFELTGKPKPEKTIYIVAQTIDVSKKTPSTGSSKAPIKKNPLSSETVLGSAPKSSNADVKNNPNAEPIVYYTEKVGDEHRKTATHATLTAGKLAAAYTAKGIQTVYKRHKEAKERAKELNEQLKLIDNSFLTGVPTKPPNAGDLGLLNVEVSDSQIMQSLSRLAEKEYLHDMLPLYQKYLSSVAAVDVMVRYGKEVTIDPDLTEEIITVHKKYFGAESNADVQTIISDFEARLKEHSPEVLSLSKEQAQKTGEVIKSSILANVKIDNKTQNIAVKDTRSISKKFTDAGKAATMFSVKSMAKQSVKTVKEMIAQDTSTRSQSAIAESVDVHSNRVKQMIIYAPENINKTVKTVKITAEASKAAVKTTVKASKAAVKTTVKASKAAVKTTAKASKAAVKATKVVVKVVVKIVITIIKATAEAVASIVAAGAPVIVPVILIAALIGALIPVLVHGGTTHLSPEVPLNETYVYYSKFPADAISTYYQFVYDTSYKIPDSVYKINNPSLEEKADGLMFVAHNPGELTYIQNTDPMTFISLLSAYFLEFDFPTFYDETSSTTYNIPQGAGLWKEPLEDIFLAVKKEEKCGSNVIRTVQGDYGNAINQMDVKIETTTIPTVFYDNYWSKVGDKLKEYELLRDAVEEAYIRKQTGISVPNNLTYEKLLGEYNKLVKSEEFQLLLGNKIQEGFGKVVDDAVKEFDLKIKDALDKINDAEKQIDSMTAGAQQAAAESGKSFSCVCTQHCEGEGENQVCSEDCSCKVTRNDNAQLSAELQAMSNEYKKQLEEQRKTVEDVQKKVKEQFTQLKDITNIDPLEEGKADDVGRFARDVQQMWGKHKTIVSEIEKQYKRLLDIIGDYKVTPEQEGTLTKLLDKLLDEATKEYQTFANQLTPPSGGVCIMNICVAGSCCEGEYQASLNAFNAGLGKINQGIDTIKGYPDLIKKLSNEFQEKLRKTKAVAVANIGLKTAYTDTTTTDFGEEIPPIELQNIKKAFDGNNVGIYILRNVLTATDERTQNAKNLFVQSYMPYGKLFKQELSIGEDMSIGDFTFLRHLGYYYDPIVAYEKYKSRSKDLYAMNPKKYPISFTTTSTDTNYYYTKETGIFMEDLSNWHDSMTTYLGSVMTLNVNAGFDPFNPQLVPFNVYVPIAGKMKIYRSFLSSGNTVIIEQETASAKEMGEQPYEVRLRGVTVDYSNFTATEASLLQSGEAIEVTPQQLLGTAEMLYVTYLDIETRKVLIFFTTEHRFYREPSVYYGVPLEDEDEGLTEPPNAGDSVIK